MLESCLRRTQIGSMLLREKRYAGLGIPCLSLIGTVLCMMSVAMGTFAHAAGLWLISRTIVTFLYPQPSSRDQGWEAYVADLIETVQITGLPVGLWIWSDHLSWGAISVLMSTLYVKTCSFHYINAIKSKRELANTPLQCHPPALIAGEEFTLAFFWTLLSPLYAVCTIQNSIALLVALLLSLSTALDLHWSSQVFVRNL